MVIFEDGVQLNNTLGQSIQESSGTHTYKIYAQKESMAFAGSKLTFTFGDNSSVSATIQSFGTATTAQISQMANVLNSVKAVLDGIKTSLGR